MKQRALLYPADKHVIRVMSQEHGMTQKDMLRVLLHRNEAFKSRWTGLRMDIRENET